MTCLKNLSRFAVALLTLIGLAAAAIPSGWIALRYEPPAAGEQKGHWILVKAPEDGLAAWWSDAEIAKIVANDPAYVKRLETDWTPVDHPVADPDEASRLSVALAQYWGGDVPQANYWAHGAMTRRGATLRAYRWEQDGAAQRSGLEQAGDRPVIPAAAFDPDPVDQRYDNQTDVVTYGDRWGDHLLGRTLDHVYQAELNKAKRRHHPNPPPAAEIQAASKATVQACREESLKVEMGVFENYVRGWGGLTGKNVSFGLPANCVADPGPPTPYTACDGSKHATQQAADAVQCTTDPPDLYTACDGSRHATQQAADAVQCTIDPPDLYTACDGSRHATQEAADAVQCTIDPPDLYTACDGSKHATQQAADAVQCTIDPPDLYTACDGSKHATQQAADAVQCITDPPDLYTACDGSKHATQQAANAVQCTTDPSECKIAWLCGNNPDPDPDPNDPDPDTPDLDPNDGGANTGGGNDDPDVGGGKPPLDYEACDGSKHASQAAADAVVCTPEFRACDDKLYKTQAEADAVSCTYTACDGSTHNSKTSADAVDCSQKYTACDGSEHDSQAAANAVDCSLQERQQILHDLTCEGTVDGNTGQCDDLIITP